MAAEEFDFDSLMDDTETVLKAARGDRSQLDAIGTLAVAGTFFTAATMLYMEERLRDPDAPPAKALETARERADNGIEEHTRAYFGEMLEYNGVDRDEAFESVDEAVDYACKMEHEIMEKAFHAIEGVLRRGEPFFYFAVAASGKDPDEHLAKIHEDGDGFDSFLDDLNWK